MDYLQVMKDQLENNGLSGWKAAISRGKNTIGLCNYSKKTIYISKHHVETDDHAYIMDTIFHEVAHALTQGHGHDAVWKSKARELGGSGEQYSKHRNYPSKWVRFCVNGHEHTVFRWDKRTVYNCKCGSLLYTRRSDRSDAELSAEYVSRFNRLARARGLLEIRSTGAAL